MKDSLIINNQKINFTNLDKILFPKSKITKGNLIEYYLSLAPKIIKYIKYRPITLQRFPRGIHEQGFIQKHAQTIPEWIEHLTLPSKKGDIEYLMINKKADLAYLVNLNTITFHATFSNYKNIHYPDTLLLDLDPSDGNFNKVIKVAFIIKDICDHYKINTYVKTTGSKGIHIHIPIDESAHFDKIHELSKNFAKILALLYPKEITVMQLKAQRKGLVLVDYARNSYGQTAVAPYSIRAKELAPIAAPIDWEELGTTVRASDQFNLGNIHQRLKIKKKLWQNTRKVNSFDKLKNMVHSLK